MNPLQDEARWRLQSVAKTTLYEIDEGERAEVHGMFPVRPPECAVLDEFAVRIALL